MATKNYFMNGITEGDVRGFSRNISEHGLYSDLQACFRRQDFRIHRNSRQKAHTRLLPHRARRDRVSRGTRLHLPPTY